MISNLNKVEKFDLLDCFDSYEFHPFGIYGRSENGIKKIMTKEKNRPARELFRNCRELFIISPFLSEGIITDLLEDKKDGPDNRCLITRENFVTRKIYDAFNKGQGNGIYVVDPVFSTNDALDDGETFGYVKRDVHAKVYYTSKDNEPKKLYLGSLNASRNAFENNVEFLLELQYKSYYASYSSIKDDFIPTEESPFIPMSEYREEVIEPEAEVDFRAEVYGVIGAKVITDDGGFNIEVYADADYEDVSICPFYVRTQMKALTKITRFEKIALNSLSNMFVLTKDGTECLIRLEVEDMPEDERDDAIFNEIISNKPMFMTYMRYLLDEDFYDSVSFEELLSGKTEAGTDAVEYGFSVEPDIYEKMLRAAAEYPERFDSMYEVVERLDDNRIGDEFRQLLELFMQASGRKRKGRK